MESNNRTTIIVGFALMALACLMIVLVIGCGSGSDGGPTGSSHIGTTQSAPIARITGAVILRTNHVTLSRAPGEEFERSAERTAALAAVADCGAVPAGWVVVPNAAITVSGENLTTTTDANGCFSFDIYNMGIKIFTATKTNSKGGTTILQKVADVQPGVEVRFTQDDSIKILSTVVSMIVQDKLDQGETDIDVSAIEAYVESIEEQEEVQQIMAQIAAAADPDDTSVASFDDIDTTSLSNGVLTLQMPAIFNASVTGSPVAAAGGDAGIYADVMAYGDSVTIQSVEATLSSASLADITVVLTSTGSGHSFAGTHTFPANPNANSITYSVTLRATDSNNMGKSYSTSTLTITQLGLACGNGMQEGTEACDDAGESAACDSDCTAVACGDGTVNATAGETCDAGANNGQPGQCNTTCNGTTSAAAVCGNGVVETGETCDDSNTATEACAYGQTSCTVCNAACQSVAGATSYCGDGTADAANGETCDDNGESAVCDANCTAVSCGDGTKNATAGETCDDGANNGAGIGYCDALCSCSAACTTDADCADTSAFTITDQCYAPGSCAVCRYTSPSLIQTIDLSATGGGNPASLMLTTDNSKLYVAVANGFAVFDTSNITAAPSVKDMTAYYEGAATSSTYLRQATTNIAYSMDPMTNTTTQIDLSTEAVIQTANPLFNAGGSWLETLTRPVVSSATDELYFIGSGYVGGNPNFWLEETMAVLDLNNLGGAPISMHNCIETRLDLAATTVWNEILYHQATILHESLRKLLVPTDVNEVHIFDLTADGGPLVFPYIVPSKMTLANYDATTKLRGAVLDSVLDRLFVTNIKSSAVHVVNPDTETETASSRTVSAANANGSGKITFMPNTSTYLDNTVWLDLNGAALLFDATNMGSVCSIPVEAGAAMYDILADPAHDRVYITSMDTDKLYVLGFQAGGSCSPCNPAVENDGICCAGENATGADCSM